MQKFLRLGGGPPLNTPMGDRVLIYHRAQLRIITRIFYLNYNILILNYLFKSLNYTLRQ